eukprot:8569906-Lingulodinium_polyedra.AAC.1
MFSAACDAPPLSRVAGGFVRQRFNGSCQFDDDAQYWGLGKVHDLAKVNTPGDDLRVVSGLFGGADKIQAA